MFSVLFLRVSVLYTYLEGYRVGELWTYLTVRVRIALLIGTHEPSSHPETLNPIHPKPYTYTSNLQGKVQDFWRLIWAILDTKPLILNLKQLWKLDFFRKP